MTGNPAAHPLTFGFDIGIASVGWAVLDDRRIVDHGVRAFDKAETADRGEPLNLARRTARLLRRRLRRRAWRLVRVARLLKREGLIADSRWFLAQPSFADSTWRLRIEGLNRRLSDEEWARVIYHLCKHRGFHWTSRAEERMAEADAQGEGGKVKQGLAGTERLMKQKNYRSIAEMVLAEFPEAQRNKQGEYTKALPRRLLGDEFALLFRRQRELGQPHSGEGLEAALLEPKKGLFWTQKPSLTGEALLAMLGRCTFERAEYRAPRASFTAERHVWLTRLNNLRIVVDGIVRPLNPAERDAALPLPYELVQVTFKQLHAALVDKAGLPDEATFSGLRPAKEGKDPLSERLIRLPAWQELRTTLKRANLETEWKSIAGAAVGGSPGLLDDIARVLSVYKEDDEVRAELARLPLPGARGAVANALLDIRFEGFHALSLKALRKIVPLMATGLRYDEACVQAGYHHSQIVEPGSGEHDLLPPFYKYRDRSGRMVLRDDGDIPRNPVVLRALNQARKVMNALVRRYGAPAEVHIEMARDLSRDFDERRKIEKEQSQFRERNEKDRQDFAQAFHIAGRVQGSDFEKWRLYREQQGKCAYSLSAIDVGRLLEPGYVEVDHALPYSRSFDDSKNNKVLVFASENRTKGNLTPWEYLGGAQDSERWRHFAAFVQANKAYRIAKRSRLLRKDFDEKAAAEFMDRNLNDTRYVCRFFKNYVERHLRLAHGSSAKRCVVLSGQLTAFLRVRWGLLKLRAESDRHHALDAAVIAACSHALVKRLSDYSRRRELEQVRSGFVDPATGEIVDLAALRQLEQAFPAPWPHFRHELEGRLKIDDAEQLRAEMARFGTYPADALEALRPLFVSRAPQRRNGGAAHKDTIYGQSARMKASGSVTQKVPLQSLTLKDLDRLADPQRNQKLYAAIRARLDMHGGKGDKAFPADAPLRKPGRDGMPDGPVVRTVTMVVEKMSGIPIRGGIAKNDSMLRIDVFSKNGKFHLVPVYVHHRVSGLPDRAIVAYKDEAEWTLIDESYAWCFSVYPNDLLRITLKSVVQLGYYAGCDRSTGAISLWAHDRSQHVGSGGLIRGIGVKTALRIEKFNVGVLGDVHPAKPEKRRGLA